MHDPFNNNLFYLFEVSPRHNNDFHNKGVLPFIILTDRCDNTLSDTLILSYSRSISLSPYFFIIFEKVSVFINFPYPP